MSISLLNCLADQVGPAALIVKDPSDIEAPDWATPKGDTLRLQEGDIPTFVNSLVAASRKACQAAAWGTSLGIVGEIIMRTPRAPLTWSVKIEIEKDRDGKETGRTVFTLNPGPPDPGLNPGPNEKLAPGEPFTAQIGDGVSWGNYTPVAHMIWRTDDHGTPDASMAEVPRGMPPNFNGLMSDPIAPGGSSSQEYVVTTAAAPPTTIHYCCLLHPNEKGSITVIDRF
jgi:hypothetical protein